MSRVAWYDLTVDRSVKRFHSLTMVAIMSLSMLSSGNAAPPEAERTIGEMRQTFSVKGEPVSPLLVEVLTQRNNEGKNFILTGVDFLAAMDSPDYAPRSGSPSWKKHVNARGYVTYDRAARYCGETNATCRMHGYFEYQYQGKLANGLLVVEYTDGQASSSGTERALLILRLKQGEPAPNMFDQRVYEPLVLKPVSHIDLNCLDHWKIDGNSLTVTYSKEGLCEDEHLTDTTFHFGP